MFLHIVLWALVSVWPGAGAASWPADTVKTPARPGEPSGTPKAGSLADGKSAHPATSPADSAAKTDPQALTLESAVVTANPPLMMTRGDTLLFHPAAISVEDDAMLEDLLKAIPGLEYDGRTLTLYGRKIEQLLVRGQLYFGGDVITGLKHIRAEAISGIQVYEKPDEASRLAGVDDGETVPVIDITIKSTFLDKWKGRVQGNAGLPLRYLAGLDAGMLTDTTQLSVFANLRNTFAAPAAGKTTLTRYGTGGSGEADRRALGADYSLNRRKLLKVNAHVKHEGYNRYQQRHSWSQSVYPSSISYGTTDAGTDTRNDKVTADATVTWRPRRQWSFYAKPVLSLTSNGSWSVPLSRSFSEDPASNAAQEPLNTTFQRNASYSLKGSGSVILQATRYLKGKRGRTVSLRLSGAHSESTADRFNDYLITYRSGKTSPRRYYSENPWRRNDFSVQISANEPLGRGFHLQGIINARIDRQEQDRTFYSLAGVPGAGLWGLVPTLDGSLQRASLPSGWESGLSPALTSEGSYTGRSMNIIGSLRYVRKKWNTTFGVSLRPVWSDVGYVTEAEPDGRASSFVFYAAPNVTIRYKRSKKDYVRLIYSSFISPPPAGRLIPVASGTNPLYVSVGNPDLKPSFTHRIRLTYNYSNPLKGSSMVGEAEARMVRNAFTSSTEYIPETGGRTTRAMNIDGNRYVTGSITFNQPLKKTPFSLSSNLFGRAGDAVTFLYNSSSKQSEVSTMRRWVLKERMDVKGRWRKFSALVRFGAEYSSERSLLRPALRQHPYSIYGDADLAWKLPGRWRISTDGGLYSAGGRGISELDRDLWLWNASVSKSLAKGKCTLRLRGIDLLDTRTHVTWWFGASGKGWSSYNGGGRTVLLQMTWRFG